MKYLYLKFFQSRNHNYMMRRIYLIYMFLLMAALVVSAAAVVGVKAYNYYSMPALMRANLEALSQNESSDYRYKSLQILIETSNGPIACCDTKYKSYCDIYLPCSDFGY